MRYFTIAFKINDSTGNFDLECEGFFNRKVAKDTIKEALIKAGHEIDGDMAIASIFEFKSEQDYKDYVA